MILKVVYDDDSQPLVDDLKKILPHYPLINLETYHEGLFKERKKAFKVKGAYSARHTPFAVLLDNDSKAVYAFYSEASTCTLDVIVKTLNDFIPYDKKVH